MEQRTKLGPLACPPHFDIVSADSHAIRRVAFRTSALQKNLAQTHPMSRSWRSIELLSDEYEEFLDLVPGAELFLTSVELRYSTLLRCYDSSSGNRLLEVTCPTMVSRWNQHLFFPSEKDDGNYIFSYISCVSDNLLHHRSPLIQVGFGSDHLTPGLQEPASNYA